MEVGLHMFNARNLVQVGLVAALLAPASAFASVYGTDVGLTDYTGSRSVAGGGLGLLGAGTATIDWSIVDNLDGTFHYSYTLTTTAQNTISHFILDLSEDCSDFGSCFSNLVIADPDSSGGTEFGSFGTSPSNPGIPGTIQGVKVDDIDSGDDGGVFTFSFDSDRIAVWGDFYSKGGNPDVNPDKGFAVWDVGLGDHTLDDISKFIAVPDTLTTEDPGFCETHPDLCTTQDVPEPATLAVFGAGMAALGVLRRRRKV